MKSNRIESNHTYLAAAKYLTPLQSNGNETDDKTEEVNNIYNIPIKKVPKSNKWERRIARRQENQMVIDSGAASHFISENIDLPTKWQSNKTVHLSTGNTLQSKNSISLQFK